jgi:hypothetical protein
MNSIKRLARKARSKILRLSIKHLFGDHAFENMEAYGKIFQYISNEYQGYRRGGVDCCIYEFGCGSGLSGYELIKAAQDNDIKIIRYIGADSFQGLPEMEPEDQRRWSQGDFLYSEEHCLQTVRSASREDADITVIKGDFGQLQPISQAEQIPWVIHVDCDLYTSTLHALRSCAGIIGRGGGIICFDDYFSGALVGARGEREAFEEFCESANIHPVHWLNYAHNGHIVIIPSQKP